MKLLIVVAMLFGLFSCARSVNKDNEKPIIEEEIEDTKTEQEQEIETVIKNDYGNMNETWGTYEPLLNKSLVFETTQSDYHYDRLAIKFDDELEVDLDFQAHLSGKFTYYYENKEYVLNLNTVLIGYIFYGEDANSYFFIEVDNNEVRYTLRGNAKLEIDQIWRFKPY